MKVSVLMITYNHERFIAEALDSILAQTVNFQYEIVIGEDRSTDGTRDVIEQYAHRHPTVIRPLFREANIGVAENFKQTFRACEGNYIAILEGDDYWCHDGKLQMQADALDAHPDWSSVYGIARVIAEDREQPPLEIPAPDLRRAVASLGELVRVNLIPTCTVMFRNRLFDEFPAWFGVSPICDWPLHVLNARSGPAGFIEEVLSVYRQHPGGIFSRRKAIWVAEQYYFLQRYFADLASAGMRAEVLRDRAATAGQLAGLCLEAKDRRQAELWMGRYLRGGGWLRSGHRSTLCRWLKSSLWN